MIISQNRVLLTNSEIEIPDLSLRLRTHSRIYRKHEKTDKITSEILHCWSFSGGSIKPAATFSSRPPPSGSSSQIYLCIYILNARSVSSSWYSLTPFISSFKKRGSDVSIPPSLPPSCFRLYSVEKFVRMSSHDMRDTLGAVLIGSGFAALFVIFFLPQVVAQLTSEDWWT